MCDLASNFSYEANRRGHRKPPRGADGRTEVQGYRRTILLKQGAAHRVGPEETNDKSMAAFEAQMYEGFSE